MNLLASNFLSSGLVLSSLASKVLTTATSPSLLLIFIPPDAERKSSESTIEQLFFLDI